VKHKRQSGFTLSEMVISATIFSVVIGAPAALFMNVNKAYRNETFNSELDRQARRALDEISERLRLSALSTFSSPVAPPPPLPPPPPPALPTTPPSYPNVAPNSVSGFVFAEVIGYPPLPPIPESFQLQYTAADPNDGLDNDSDGLIDEQRIVWIENVGLANQRTRVITEWVRENLEGEIGNNFIDDNGNGLVDEAGLCFDLDGERLNIRLTLERRMGDGTLITHTAQRTIALRN